MVKSQIAVFIILECISLLLIVHLWLRKSKVPDCQRCLWSILLLVPLFGWLLYGFIASAPESHPDEMREHWRSNAPPGS
jgi:hypothetical protein